MAIRITPVGGELDNARLGPPPLRVLIPSEDKYTVLLMQPQGIIEADSKGVRHRDAGLARRQFGAFLKDALAMRADLVVTPEYSMPWGTLVDAIANGVVPPVGSLWALGCESITYADLLTVKDTLARHADVLHETMPPVQGKFLDPLVYVFLAPSANQAEPRLVLLVQFKTCPMADEDHLEVNHLQRGTKVYLFGDLSKELRLMSLICSDALSFTDNEAKQVYDRTLILHIQLNPKPRHDLFRQYRNKLLCFGGDATEILCLNWARDVHINLEGTDQPWRNIGGSAWYLRPDKFDTRDKVLAANHRLGLYYTWSQSLRAHVLFFNYLPAVYQLISSKVAHVRVPAPLSCRPGPQLTDTYLWDDATSTWRREAGQDDGFSSIVGECGAARDDIHAIASGNPFWAERALALSAGAVTHSSTWYLVRELDSCGIAQSEVVRRLTFCQDAEQDASAFRTARLRRCRTLRHILADATLLPPELSDLTAGMHMVWEDAFPHQNVMSSAGRRATLVFLGSDVNDTQVEAVYKTLSEHLWRMYPDADSLLQARQRLHVWYYSSEEMLCRFDTTKYRRIDDPRSSSEFDITRAT